jgi:hypothetical protein
MADRILDRIFEPNTLEEEIDDEEDFALYRLATATRMRYRADEMEADACARLLEIRAARERLYGLGREELHCRESFAQLAY